MQEVVVTSNYEKKGNANLIACSYERLAQDVRPGTQILCADGSLVLTVEECFPNESYVKCRAVNTATIGSAARLDHCSARLTVSVPCEHATTPTAASPWFPHALVTHQEPVA